MRKTISVLAVSLLLTSCGLHKMSSNHDDLLPELHQFYANKQFFQLRHHFEKNRKALSEANQLYFNALIDNTFNRGYQSNEKITQLLETHISKFSDDQLSKLYQVKLNNHINLYEYSQAAETSELLLGQYEAALDSVTTVNLRNEIKIWQALSDVPPQQVSIFKDNNITMTRDKVGLFNIDVTFKNRTMNFLFDTGANFSAVKRSLVDPLGLQYIESDFYVTAATGAQVKTDLAIASSLIIGDMIFRNVVFLILEDEDVSFPQIDYYVNGVIGFPVIEAMEEIQISEGLLHVPQNPASYQFRNLALDQLMPIVSVHDGHHDLLFHFDSGATNTSLFPAYYKLYEKAITSQYEMKTLSSASAGGAVEFSGYDDIDVSLEIADSRADLHDIQLHVDDIGGVSSPFHGNLGQDYISQFDKFIISFKYASITFE